MGKVGDITKWSFGEMTSSGHNGKTSVTATSGFMVIVVGLIGFLITIWFKNVELVFASIGVITIGAGLLGYNKKKTSEINKLDLTNIKNNILDENETEKGA